MLKYNALRFGTDTFQMNRQGLLTAKTPLDATTVTSVTGFTISGEQPENTERRIAFKIDGELKKFSGSDLVRLSGDETFDNIIQNGNTVAELLALTNIPAFVGQKIYPIIALSASDSAEEMPTIKLALNGVTNSQQLTKTVETAEMNLTTADGSTPQIISVTTSETCTASGSISVSVALKNNDTWGEFIPLADAAEQVADAVKFKIVYSVDAVGNEHSAKLNSITVRYNSGTLTVTGTDAAIYSVTQNFEDDLQTCYVVVRHQRLIDSSITADVAFRSQPLTREFKSVGTGTGSSATFNLGDTDIVPNSLRLFVNGNPFANFDYDSAAGTVTANVANGAVITASYQYGGGAETWHAMTKEIDQQVYPDGARMTCFTFALGDDETADMQISAVRINLSRPTGTVIDQSLGKATGKTQQFVLPHFADPTSITCTGSWSYNADDKILTVVATKNTVIRLNYTWRGEQVTVYSWAAGWNAAV